MINFLPMAIALTVVPVQDTLNHDSLLSISSENNRIDSLVIIKREQNKNVANSTAGIQEPKCRLRRPPCP